jgi:hypothetical protein
MHSQFPAIMADKQSIPVIINDSSGEGRVAMLTAVWLRKIRGYTVEKTAKVIEKINNDRKITDTESKFITQLAN